MKDYEKTLEQYLDKVANQASKNVEEHKTILEASVEGKKSVEEYNRTYKLYSKANAKNKKILEASPFLFCGFGNIRKPKTTEIYNWQPTKNNGIIYAETRERIGDHKEEI